MTFLELVHTDAKLIWDGEAHRARSITKAERFAAFEDFESRCITAFKPSHIHRFFDHLAECGLSNNTINHYGAMVVKVMGWACNEEFITHVPKFKYRKVKGNQRPLYFTTSQIDSIMQFFRNHEAYQFMEHYMTIGIQTGMRIGEIRKINRETLILDETGGYSIFLEMTKNGDSREVPLNELALRSVHALGVDIGKHWDSKAFYKAFGQMRAAILDNDYRYTFHTTRHTCATILANTIGAEGESTYNTDIIGKLLGHRDLNTTRKYIKTKQTTLRTMVSTLRKEQVVATSPKAQIETHPPVTQGDLFGLVSVN
jgi:integrase